MDNSVTAVSEIEPSRSSLSWKQKLLAMGFMFFLIKGLLWLLVPGVIAVVAWLK